jgi:hypothetical protein
MRSPPSRRIAKIRSVLRLKDPVGAEIRGLVRFAEWEIGETSGETGFLEP